MILKKHLLAASFLLSPVFLIGQVSGAPPRDLLKPLKDSWPTYNGDYSGKRFSALTQVNRLNVRQLTLAGMSQVTSGAANPRADSVGGGPRGPERSSLIVGVEGPDVIAIRRGSRWGSVL